MGNLASPLQVASVLVWPLLAGLGVVFWSRARAAAHARRVAAMDGQLKGLYRTVQAKPLRRGSPWLSKPSRRARSWRPPPLSPLASASPANASHARDLRKTVAVDGIKSGAVSVSAA
ncbi:MAG: hypothetical protein JWQ97_2333 [Phenylobacterium sp.]|nr:hypothetical protein [Phenylobacterium sp.]